MVLLVLAAVTAAGGAVAARSLGHVLHHEDPLERADAVFVLGGSWMERVAEGGHLYLEGYARHILLSHDPNDRAVHAWRAKGVRLPEPSDVQIQSLVLMGVPREAIDVLDPQTATASEARALQDYAGRRGWRSVIVVTHKLHTARARLVMHRRAEDLPLRIIMRATRYDPADLDRWWESRVDLRFALIEAQKMLLYWSGIAD